MGQVVPEIDPPNTACQILTRFTLISGMTKNPGEKGEFHGSADNFTACGVWRGNPLLVKIESLPGTQPIQKSLQSIGRHHFKSVSHIKAGMGPGATGRKSWRGGETEGWGRGGKGVRLTLWVLSLQYVGRHHFIPVFIHRVQQYEHKIKSAE